MRRFVGETITCPHCARCHIITDDQHHPLDGRQTIHCGCGAVCFEQMVAGDDGHDRPTWVALDRASVAKIRTRNREEDKKWELN